jgi:uncharacterized protein YutE (UPF0331/DUF86 family)
MGRATLAAVGNPHSSAVPACHTAIEYTFVTAIESCADVAQHSCASEGWRPAGRRRCDPPQASISGLEAFAQ